MALFAEEQKVDLLSRAAEVGLDVSPTVSSLELMRIQKEKQQKEREEGEKGERERDENTVLLKRLEIEAKREQAEKERENAVLLKKVELEIRSEENRVNYRRKSEVFIRCASSDPKVGDISLYLTLFELQMERAKLPEELWVLHLIELLPNDMAQLIAR
ncbi:hypothetical protein AVEN_270944-1 [Araneus ventricosus]|uniref:Uncharacterized protein n=1 Tax=Araneus ventricosus TaxID=182803 RepID=A0A4Y2R9B2_ARAVE|nr:hypothetical protein AVEN_270944-1 [Araneus ventricosus]